MPAPSVTYTFSNGTTADATQVNQNFTDLINGVSDGTKDLSISALTCAGTATLNGNVTLGNASSDDLTITASLASTVAVKTTNTYDIAGSTIGLRSLYLADAGSAARTTRILGGTVASSWTLTLPVAAGTAGYPMTNLGSGSTIWLPPASTAISNYGIASSVGANALTVALKGADGNDASATNPIYINFRSSTAATGTPVLRAVTGALSLVVSSGSTLGSVSGAATKYFIYAIDNAGTVELAIAGISAYDDGTVVTTTAEGGAGAADSKYVIYSTSARSGVACRLIGRITATEATAGTWATAPSEISLAPFNKSLGQTISSSSSTFTTNSGTAADVTNLTATITTSGRPVYILVQPDASASESLIEASGAAAAYVYIVRDSTTLTKTKINLGTSEMPGGVSYVDVVAAGSYTYKLQASSNGVNNMAVTRCVLVVFEL